MATTGGSTAKQLRAALAGVSGLLLDLDGVIVLAGQPVPGAPEAVRELTRRGVPFRIVTNTSLVSRATLSKWSERLGAPLPANRFQSALSVAAAFTARRYGGRPLFVLASEDALTEFTGQRLLSVEEAALPGATAAAVVVGDSPESVTWVNLNLAFRLLRHGADLIGMHKNRWWITPEGPTLDSGAFVAGLEFAAGVKARIVGKPAPAFFSTAAADLARDARAAGQARLRRADVAMVGDDVWTDALAARRAGLRGVVVLSGKHGRAELERAAAQHRGGGSPDAVAASLADVVAALDWAPQPRPPAITEGPMTTESKPRLKITYATLRNDNEELHAQFDAGVEKVRSILGKPHQNYVGGAWRDGDGTFDKRTPIDGSVMGTFARGSRKDVQDAIAAARAAFPAWGRRPWQERVALLRRAADIISERQMEFGALLAMEVGKNRLEALGDVEETADLVRWSCDMMERNHGFDDVMGNLGDAAVHTRSVLKPYGVWGVISPFNFPFALSGGPAGGALVAGNTVVYKPSSDAPLSGALLTQTFIDAGLPAGVFNMVAGPGETVGAEIQENPGVDGVIFTGSFEVGFGLYKNFARQFPKPVIVEMGGKNPAIVSRKADLDEAAEGIMRSAFGFSGQKCSANSRVYVERPVHDELIRRLVEKTEAITIGDPVRRENWLGPVINQKAVARYEQAVSEARGDGRVVIGGERVTEHGLDEGFFVAPTIATELPTSHRLFRDELFLPFTVVAPVDSIDEAMRLSNDTVLGLTAGFYSEDRAEIDRFLEEIEAGVVYVNRRAGATTGAWPGIQPFGGWKGSTATGKAGGGFYYVQQFMREQSQTIVD